MRIDKLKFPSKESIGYHDLSKDGSRLVLSVEMSRIQKWSYESKARVRGLALSVLLCLGFCAWLVLFVLFEERETTV
jgi:hypothetical protein